MTCDLDILMLDTFLSSKINKRKFILAAVGGEIVATVVLGHYQYAGKPPTMAQTLPSASTLTTLAAAANLSPDAVFIIGIDSVTGTTHCFLDDLKPVKEASSRLEPSEIPSDLSRWRRTEP